MLKYIKIALTSIIGILLYKLPYYTTYCKIVAINVITILHFLGINAIIISSEHVVLIVAESQYIFRITKSCAALEGILFITCLTAVSPLSLREKIKLIAFLIMAIHIANTIRLTIMIFLITKNTSFFWAHDVISPLYSTAVFILIGFYLTTTFIKFYNQKRKKL